MNKKFTRLTAALALLALLIPPMVGWGQTRDSYSYTFESTQFNSNPQTVTLNEIDWTFTGTGGDYFGYDATKGQQFGSGKKPYSACTLSTTGIEGTITDVTVNTSGASSINATLSITVGETNLQYGNSNTYTLTSSATEVSFTGSASGSIVLSYSNSSSKAIYIKSIAVTYTTGGGSGSTTYTVTFDCDGGEGCPDDITGIEPGENNFNVPNDTPTKEHYTFDNFYLGSDDEIYESGETYTISSDLELTASWTINKYNVAMTSDGTDAELYAEYGDNMLAEDENADINYGTELTLQADDVPSGNIVVWTITNSSTQENVTEAVLNGSTVTVPDYAITITGVVTPVASYTITFVVPTDATAVQPIEGYENQVITLPTAQPSQACAEDWTFAGWATQSISDTTTAPELLTGSYTIENNATLYAVYKQDGSSNCSVTFADNGYTDGEAVAYATIGECATATFDKGTSSNAPKYYSTGTAIRLYAKNTMTITGTNLSAITLSFGTGDGSNAITTDVGSYDNGTWTGSASSVTFTVGGTSGHRRIAGIAVVSGGTVAYNSNPVCMDQVATPTFTVEEGTYYTTQSVEISCATEEATIYYTSDGSDPTNQSTQYNGAISVEATTTIKAIAMKEGMADSEIAEATYTILGTYNITYSEAEHGSISGEATAHNTETVEVTATPENGYYLASMTYSYGDNSDNATVNGNTGTFTMPASDVTVSATFSQIQSLTVAQAREAIDVATTLPIQNQFVRGIVCTASTSIYNGKLSYWISDDGTTTNRLQAYNGLSFNGEAFTSKDDVQVGDVVMIKGNLTLYNSTTYEIVESQLVTLERNPSINANDIEIEYTATGGSIAYTINNAPTPAGSLSAAIVGTSEIEGLTIGTITNDAVSFTCSANTITSPRTATVKLTYTYGDSQTVEKNVIITQQSAPKQDVTMTFNPTALMATLNVEFTEPTLTTNPTGLTVTYSSSVTSVATVDGSTGELTLVDAGTTVITATFAGNDDYNSATASYPLFVSADPTIPVLAIDEASISPTAATALWTPCQEVDSYTLEIAPVAISESFEGGAVPQGWTNDGTIISSGKGGDGTYCIGFNGSGDNIITPALSNPKAISFMYKRSSNTAGWSLNISYATSPNAEEWAPIGTVESATTTWQTYSAPLDVTGDVYIKFTDTRSSGTAERYIDLVQIAGEYTSQSVSGTSYTFDNLSAGATYYARVKGNNDYSDVVSFTTLPFTLDIAGYGNSDGGWHLIAIPVMENVTPSTANGFIAQTADNYDLYIFDESEEQEWRNYKVMDGDNHANFSELVSGKGYLYASKYDTQLAFTGTPYSGDGIVTLSKTDNVEFSGWNLVGNPFGSSATLDKPYYRLNTDGDALNTETEDTEVSAMEGVFVEAEENGESVTFALPTNNSDAVEPAGIGQLNIKVMRTRGGNVIDNAIVRFDGGAMLGKFQLNENGTKLYVPQSGKEYAIVNALSEGEMPVNFHAAQKGTYVLAVDSKNVEVTYLHLIDNMTGADIDLLAEPSYTFSAKTTDYASRFRLVFNANNGSNENETFAFFNGSEWMISNMGEATLQVVDVMGRVLSSETVSGNATMNLNQTPGVYMFRLVNGDSVKVQKVVVR